MSVKSLVSCVGGQELGPEGLHLALEVGGLPGVVENEVSRTPPGLAVNLRGDPGPGVLLRQSTAGHQPAQLDLRIDVDDHADVEAVLLARLHQQRDHVDDKSGRQLLLQLSCPGPDGWVDDSLQLPPCCWIGEDQRAQPGPVEAGTVEYAESKPLHDCRQRRRSGLYHLASQQISVDDDGPAFGEPFSDGALSRGDSSGEGDSQHLGSLVSRQATALSPPWGGRAVALLVLAAVDQFPPVSFSRRACRASSEASDPSGADGVGAAADPVDSVLEE